MVGSHQPGLVRSGAKQATATAVFTLTSVDSTVTIDTAWLTANGWTTPDAGLTYTTNGTYGGASFHWYF